MLLHSADPGDVIIFRGEDFLAIEKPRYRYIYEHRITFQILNFIVILEIKFLLLSFINNFINNLFYMTYKLLIIHIVSYIYIYKKFSPWDVLVSIIIKTFLNFSDIIIICLIIITNIYSSSQLKSLLRQWDNKCYFLEGYEVMIILIFLSWSLYYYYWYRNIN